MGLFQIEIMAIKRYYNEEQNINFSFFSWSY